MKISGFYISLLTIHFRTCILCPLFHINHTFPIWDWVFICVNLLLMVDSVFDNSFIWRQIKRQPLCESAKLPTNLQSTPFEEWGDEIFLYKYPLFSLISPRTSGQCPMYQPRSRRLRAPPISPVSSPPSSDSSQWLVRLSTWHYRKHRKTSKSFLSMTLIKINTFNQRKM